MPNDQDPQIPQWAKPGPYVTSLSTDEEARFQQWVKDNKIPWQDIPTADYDMRGYWKGTGGIVPSTGNRHFPDIWKTPYHKTFSNESIYATPDAPHWDGNKLIDKNGKVIMDESTKADFSGEDSSLLSSANQSSALLMLLLLACASLAHASGWQSGVCIEDGSSMWTAGDKLIVRESGEYTVYRIDPKGGWNDLTHDFSAPMRVEIGKFSSLEAAEGMNE